jgi:hypothetical protein
MVLNCHVSLPQQKQHLLRDVTPELYTPNGNRPGAGYIDGPRYSPASVSERMSLNKSDPKFWFIQYILLLHKDQLFKGRNMLQLQNSLTRTD